MLRHVDIVRRSLEQMRLLAVGGIPFGVVVAGVGSRLLMLLLRVTSPDNVRGIQSDDDFEIGRFTLGGTYNLLLLGAGVGIIGIGTYQFVAPHLLGPSWFRGITVGLASGAVVGSLLLHADGIDFTLLKPTWLAIACFIALPAVFGLLVGPAFAAVKKPTSWTRRRPWLVVVPLICVVCFPPVLVLLAFLSPIVVLGAGVASSPDVQQLRSSTAWINLMRALWMGIALLGLVAVIRDISQITASSTG